MDIVTLVTVLVQLGWAAAAWRLASRLATRVDNHETRIVTLEAAPN